MNNFEPPSIFLDKECKFVIAGHPTSHSMSMSRNTFNFAPQSVKVTYTGTAADQLELSPLIDLFGCGDHQPALRCAAVGTTAVPGH